MKISYQLTLPVPPSRWGLGQLTAGIHRDSMRLKNVHPVLGRDTVASEEVTEVIVKVGPLTDNRATRWALKKDGACLATVCPAWTSK